jgi:hypothetical protein
LKPYIIGSRYGLWGQITICIFYEGENASNINKDVIEGYINGNDQTTFIKIVTIILKPLEDILAILIC